QPTTIQGNTQGAFVLWADETAAEWTGTVRVFATAKVGEKTLRREDRPYTRVWSEANIATSRPTRELALAMRETAACALSLDPERIEIEAGKKAELKLKLARRWTDFKSKVGLQQAAFPGNIRLTAPEIGEGKDETTVSLDVQAGSRPCEYTLTV